MEQANVKIGQVNKAQTDMHNTTVNTPVANSVNAFDFFSMLCARPFIGTNKHKGLCRWQTYLMYLGPQPEP